MLLHGAHLHGTGTVSPIQANTGTSAAWPSGSLTPGQDNNIFLSFSTGYGNPPLLITDDEFTIVESGAVPGAASTTQFAMATFRQGTAAATQSHWSQGSSAEWQTVLFSFSIDAAVDDDPDFRVQIYDVNGQLDLIPGKAINFGNIAGNSGRVLLERHPYCFEGTDPQAEVRIANLSLAEIDVQFALYGLQGVPQ